MQYLHIVDIVVVGLDVIPHYICWFSAIPSSVVLDLAPQNVPPIIQDENGDAMEDSEWAHKSSRWFCKVDACTTPYVAKWLLRQHLKHTNSLWMQVEKSRRPSICPRGPKQQDHNFMNARILSNPHVRQKQNGKKAFD